MEGSGRGGIFTSFRSKTLELLLPLLFLSPLTYSYQQSARILKHLTTSLRRSHCLVQATTSPPSHHSPSRRPPSSPLVPSALFSQSSQRNPFNHSCRISLSYSPPLLLKSLQWSKNKIHLQFSLGPPPPVEPHCLLATLCCPQTQPHHQASTLWFHFPAILFLPVPDTYTLAPQFHSGLCSNRTCHHCREAPADLPTSQPNPATTPSSSLSNPCPALLSFRAPLTT